MISWFLIVQASRYSRSRERYRLGARRRGWMWAEWRRWSRFHLDITRRVERTMAFLGIKIRNVGSYKEEIEGTQLYRRFWGIGTLKPRVSCSEQGSSTHFIIYYIRRNVILSIHSTVTILNISWAEGCFTEKATLFDGIPLRSYYTHHPGVLDLWTTLDYRRSQVHWHTLLNLHTLHTFTPITRDELRISLPGSIWDMERKI